MDEDCPLEPGLCHCGCGKKTKIAKQSYSRSGSIKGQPNKYLTGHAKGRQSSDVKHEQCYETPANRPNGFYVYIYLRSTPSEKYPEGSPYYVGKGKKYRAWSITGRYTHRPKEDKYIKIVESGMFEDDAFQLEMSLIRQYGRIDLGTGILRNLTDGGEGNSHRSEEQIRRMSEAQKARWADEELRPNLLRHVKTMNKGRKHTEETKKKWSEQKKGIKTGRVMSDEEKEHLSLKNKGHRGRAKGQHIVKHGTLWEYRCGCRCEECRKCNAESCRKSKMRKIMLTGELACAIINT
jgi:hypothetical protein